MIKLPQFQPRLAVAGHIKNGINTPVVGTDGVQLYDRHNQPKMRPEQLDHYLVTTLLKDPVTKNFIVDEEVMRVLPKDSDGKCRRIPILVHSDDFRDFFPTELAARQGKVITCRGDGEKATRVKVEQGQKIGQPYEVSCPCPWLDPPLGPGGAQKSDPVCKANATLRCKIAMPEAITIGSVYDYHTTSVIGVPDMLGGFSEIQTMIGTLVWVPLWLVLRAVKVQPDGYAKTVYSSFVHLRGSDVKAIQDRAIGMVKAAREVHQIAGRTSLVLPLPPAPTEEDSDELDEFYDGNGKPDRDNFDPVTGEVIEDPKPEAAAKGPKTTDTKASGTKGATGTRKTSTVPASELTKASAGYTAETQPEDPPKPETKPQKDPEPEAKPEAVAGAGSPKTETTQTELLSPDVPVGFDEVLPKDDPLRAQIGRLLKELAALRGFTGDKQLQAGMKEILAALTTELLGSSVAFGALKLGHAMKLQPEIERLIQLKRNEAEDDEPSESAEDTDDIPT